MARRARAPQKSDLIATITDTIASHPRLSAAVAFQMGVLLGQVMQNREAAFGALKRSVGAAPAALASALPAFGLFDTASSPVSQAPRRRSRKASGRKRRKAQG
jgi:hypothetical protein